MRSVPRISYDMNQVNRPEKKTEPLLEEHDSKTSFFATRRDFLYTTFIEDPQLVLKRQKELEEENLNKMKDQQIKDIPPPQLPTTMPSPSTSSPATATTTTTTIQNTNSKPISPQTNKKIKIRKETPKIESHSIKKMTKYEIDNVVDRLTSTNENIYSIRTHRNNNIDKEKPLIRRKIIDGDNDAVFERLYIESTQQKTENKNNNDEYKNFNSRVPESDTAILSKSIALQKIKEMIDTSFPDKQSLTLDELNDIFVRLGILEHCEKIEKIPQISYIIEKWKIRNTELYDINIIKNVLIQSIIGRKGKFKHFARERMFSALANRKNNENIKSNQQYCYSNQGENQPTHSKCLTQETFERLLSPRPIFSPPKNEEEEEDFSYNRLELSAETQKILKKSEYGNVKLEERDKKLAERAMAKIEDIRNQMEKEMLKMQKKYHASKINITPEERAKIDELKQKRQNDIENEKPTYKPDVMKYSDFLHLKESMKEEKEKPPGLDAFLGRMKKGYEQYQKKKFEQENIRSLPQLPSKRRCKSENKKKKKEQSDQKEVIEEPQPPPPPVEIIDEINKKAKNETKESKKQQENAKNNQKNTNNKRQKNTNVARSQKTIK